MATDDYTMNPERDVGQGDRDVDERAAREQAERGARGGAGTDEHSAMPDFTSGPGYTGEIPPEGESPEEGDWNAGGDVSRG